MLLVSTRLGLIACRYLAEGYEDGKWITAPEIARHYNVNVRSLMPILRKLVQGGVLYSRVGGATPGFILARPPEEIMLSEVLGLLEGNISIPCCMELIGGLNCDCDGVVNCKIHEMFSDMVNEAANRLKTTSIAEFTKNGIREM